jgi:hypothetical protein
MDNNLGLELLQTISKSSNGVIKDKFSLGFLTVDRFLFKKETKLTVFAFDKKEYSGVLEFVCDGAYKKDEGSVVLVKLPGHLEKKFTALFQVNTLTCFCSEQQEVFDLAVSKSMANENTLHLLQ